MGTNAMAFHTCCSCRELCESETAFEGLVQRNLAADSGLDFKEWAALLTVAISAALRKLLPGGTAADHPGSSSVSSDAPATRGEYTLLELQRAEWAARELLAATQAADALASECSVEGGGTQDGLRPAASNPMAAWSLDALEAGMLDEVSGKGGEEEVQEEGDGQKELAWVSVLREVHTRCRAALQAHGVAPLAPGSFVATVKA